MTRKILVATDGTPGSLGALRVAGLLARREQAGVRVVSVYEPVPLFSPGPEAAVISPGSELDRGRLAALRQAVAEQVRALGGEAPGWPLEVLVGQPAPTLVRHAEAVGAGLILLGSGHHALSDRWMRGETGLRVTRLAHRPVLAVPSEARELPRRALVGVDFSALSLSAARAAAELLCCEGELHLLHVTWPSPPHTHPGEEAVGWLRQYRRETQEHLAAVARELRESSGLTVRAEMIEGDPAHELVAHARRVDADLVATGSHGYGFFSRLMLGSVSTRVLRQANGMVLIWPPQALVPELAGVESSEPVGGTAMLNVEC